MPAFTFEKLSPPAAEDSLARLAQKQSAASSKRRVGVLRLFGRFVTRRASKASSRENAEQIALTRDNA